MAQSGKFPILTWVPIPYLSSKQFKADNPQLTEETKTKSTPRAEIRTTW